MKKITTLVSILFFSVCAVHAVECEVAYQDATYGYQHAETAMEANNVTQLKQYADRSMIAIKKVLLSTEKCGCQAASDASYDALENLEKALEKEKFEAVRLFVNRAKANAKDVIIALDNCSANDPDFSLKESEGNLLAQEKELLERQQQLLEQQRQLEARIKEQQRLQTEVKLQKEAMFAQQKELRASSEVTLKELEALINEFTKSMGCKDEEPLTEETYQRTLEDLQEETLTATKVFYADKAKEMANNLLNRLSSCEWKN
ncbi:MAG: hypothetical protein AAF466_09255 [Bacteroidota bacterium]